MATKKNKKIDPVGALEDKMVEMVEGVLKRGFNAWLYSEAGHSEPRPRPETTPEPKTAKPKQPDFTGSNGVTYHQVLAAQELLLGSSVPPNPSIPPVNQSAYHAVYRSRIAHAHPDRGGSTADAEKLNSAWAMVKKYYAWS